MDRFSARGQFYISLARHLVKLFLQHSGSICCRDHYYFVAWMRSLLSYSSSPGLPWTLQAETTCTGCGGTEYVEVADSELVEVLYSDGGDEQLHGNANEDGCESQDVNRTLSSFPDGNSPRGRVGGNFSPCGDAGMDMEKNYPHRIYKFRYGIASPIPVCPWGPAIGPISKK
jgi:hypothetical protein